MCQGCVDAGWITQEVLDAVEAFEEQWPESSYGPAHIVIDDTGVNDDNIQWCLDHWDEYAEEGREEEYEATKAFLRELLTWPIERRIPPDVLE